MKNRWYCTQCGNLTEHVYLKGQPKNSLKCTVCGYCRGEAHKEELTAKQKAYGEAHKEELKNVNGWHIL